MIHVYMGEGKGKSTAAFGQAIRAAGQGLSVFIAQFLKSGHSGEILFLKSQSGGLIEIYAPDKTFGFFWTLDGAQKTELALATSEAFHYAAARQCDMLVLDEIAGAISNNLLDENEVLAFLDNVPPEREVILTGRYPGEAVIARAHYVSRIDMVRHPYEQGAPARKGIEY